MKSTDVHIEYLKTKEKKRLPKKGTRTRARIDRKKKRERIREEKKARDLQE